MCLGRLPTLGVGEDLQRSSWRNQARVFLGQVIDEVLTWKNRLPEGRMLWILLISKIFGHHTSYFLPYKVCFIRTGASKTSWTPSRSTHIWSIWGWQNRPVRRRSLCNSQHGFVWQRAAKRQTCSGNANLWWTGRGSNQAVFHNLGSFVWLEANCLMIKPCTIQFALTAAIICEQKRHSSNTLAGALEQICRGWPKVPTLCLRPKRMPFQVQLRSGLVTFLVNCEAMAIKFRRTWMQQTALTSNTGDSVFCSHLNMMQCWLRKFNSDIFLMWWDCDFQVNVEHAGVSAVLGWRACTTPGDRGPAPKDRHHGCCDACQSEPLRCVGGEGSHGHLEENQQWLQDADAVSFQMSHSCFLLWTKHCFGSNAGPFCIFKVKFFVLMNLETWFWHKKIAQLFLPFSVPGLEERQPLHGTCSATLRGRASESWVLWHFQIPPAGIRDSSVQVVSIIITFTPLTFVCNIR